ncbi:hypothetical protein AAFF_G00343830 [Aldrovandia affinis]|uniref:Uncharacterized protein n=1 Tax=Aldrovandia affinis TaxID=143900 RepID=A0AAD7SK64_9TELE|nr:hypothetical protein AAFF_G00343830 [Aldrovandia affinis]
MATNRERQVGHMTGFPPAVYPFAFNSIRSHSPFDLLANSSLFGRFGADLPKEMAALSGESYCGRQASPLLGELSRGGAPGRGTECNLVGRFELHAKFLFAASAGHACADWISGELSDVDRPEFSPIDTKLAAALEIPV